jgi:hypothetical protein
MVDGRLQNNSFIRHSFGNRCGLSQAARDIKRARVRGVIHHLGSKKKEN